MQYSHLISLSKFNLPLIGTFTWPTPPGPYRATTCRGRELNYGSHTCFLDHTRTWRASPDEWSAECRGHLRDSTNMKDNKHQSHTESSQQGEDGMMITTAKWNSGTLGWPKVSWHLSYRWGKTPKKPHPGNLSRPGIEPGPAAWQAPHATACSTAVDVCSIKIIKFWKVIRQFQNSTKLRLVFP